MLRLVLAFALLACSSPAKPTNTPPGGVAATGTLTGTVSFTGTPCPEPKGPPCDGAYPNYEVVVYAEDGTTVVTKTTTDASGKYTLSLPAGKYVIFTQAGLKETDRARSEITISRDALSTIDLRVDTGIR